MRQYTGERSRQRRSSALRDMMAPLHVSVSTATTAMNHEAPEIKSKFMLDVGILLKKLLTKFWIAVVTIMLFICGITGERMTVFRIIYMSLFLVLVITFQVRGRGKKNNQLKIKLIFSFLSFFLIDILDSLEKDDVSILAHSYRLFRNHADSCIYLSISQFSRILELFAYRRELAKRYRFRKIRD